MENLLYKNYKPKALTEYIKNEVNQLEITPKYKPIVEDILLRRIYEFELSDEDIQTDLQTLKDNLHAIEVAPQKGNTLGYYSPRDKKISITRKSALYLDPEGMYTVLAHEMFHALLRGDNGKSRLSTVNTYTKQENRSLEEAIVEEAADRLVQTRKRNEGRPTYLHKSIYGYSDITFVTDAIEATYGVTEKDFLKNAIMGRERLIQFLSNHSGEPAQDTTNFLDYIEANFTTLHHTLYGKEKKPDEGYDEKEAKLDKEAKVISAVSGIFIKCECKIKELIEKADVDEVVKKENWNNIKYNHNKLVMGMRRAIEDIELYRGLDIKHHTVEAVNPYKDRTRRRINIVQAAIDLIKISGPDVPTETKAFEYGLLQSAVKDDIDEVNSKNNSPEIQALDNYSAKANRSIFKKLGVLVKDENLYRNSRVTKRYYEEQDFPKTRWNNKGICSQLKSLLEKDARITFIEKAFRSIKERYFDELSDPDNKWLLNFINKQMALRMNAYENEEKGLESPNRRGVLRSFIDRFTQKKLLPGVENIKEGIANTTNKKVPINLSEGIEFEENVEENIAEVEATNDEKESFEIPKVQIDTTSLNSTTSDKDVQSENNIGLKKNDVIDDER